MTTQRKKYTTRRPRATMRRPTKPQKRKHRQRPAPGNSQLAQIARAIADPCNGPLVSGVYGSTEGLTARTKRSYTTTNGTTDTAGMVLWVPSYHNEGSGALNMIRWSFSDSGTSIVNASTAPLGTGGASSPAGVGLKDPSYELVTSDIVNDARTLAACLQLTYSGKVTESSGQIAWIDNYSMHDLFNNRPSVDDMFDRATKTSRLGLDTYEVLFRPDDATGTDRFRSNGAEDACVNMGTGGGGILGPSAPSTTVQALGPKVIGFAYRGCEVGVVDRLVLSATKVVEWRPLTISGLTGVPPCDHVLPSTSNIVASLDRSNPSWAKRIAAGASHAAQVATSAWARIPGDTKASIARFGAQSAYTAYTGQPYSGPYLMM